jgi:hypothetical protein
MIGRRHDDANSSRGLFRDRVYDDSADREYFRRLLIGDRARRSE